MEHQTAVAAAPHGGVTMPASVAITVQPEIRTVADLIDAYMAAYRGRDTARAYRLDEWRARIGHLSAAALTDDDVFIALEAIAAAPARMFRGKTPEGVKRLEEKATMRSAATVNRYHAALSAVYTWGIKRRRLPKGTENPCRKVERQPENPGVVRFLSDDERTRLLDACRASTWPKLYALVLLAITTGARRGELLALTWPDVDLERAEAHVRARDPGGRATKNGDAKVLPLVAPVVAELARLRGDQRTGLVFGSRVRPGVPYNVEGPWYAALRASRVRRFRFHDLRHTCASYLAQDGASLLEIADVMGHRQLAMVKRYAHLTVKSKAALVQRVLGDIA